MPWPYYPHYVDREVKPWIPLDGCSIGRNKLEISAAADVWNIKTNYIEGSIVTYNGKWYISLKNENKGHLPTNPEWWIVSNIKNYIDYYVTESKVFNHSVAKYTMSASLTSIALPTLTGNTTVKDLVVIIDCPSGVTIPAGFSFTGTIYWRDGEAVAPVEGSRMMYGFTANDSSGWQGYGAEFKIPSAS